MSLENDLNTFALPTARPLTNELEGASDTEISAKLARVDGVTTAGTIDPAALEILTQKVYELFRTEARIERERRPGGSWSLC